MRRRNGGALPWVNYAAGRRRPPKVNSLAFRRTHTPGQERPVVAATSNVGYHRLQPFTCADAHITCNLA